MEDGFIGFLLLLLNSQPYADSIRNPDPSASTDIQTAISQGSTLLERKHPNPAHAAADQGLVSQQLTRSP